MNRKRLTNNYIIKELEKEFASGSLDFDEKLKILKKSKVKKVFDSIFAVKKEITYEYLKTISENEEVLNLLTMYASENDITIKEDKENMELYSTYDFTTSPFKYIYYESLKIPLYTRKEEREVFAKYQLSTDEEEKASYREDIILHNIRLVMQLATHYAKNGGKNYFLTDQDYFQEGIIGLIDSIDKFNLDKDCKFSTYARYYIFQKIDRSRMRNSRTIRTPFNSYILEKAINELRHEYFLKNNEELVFTDDVINKLAKEYKTSYKMISLALDRRKTISLDKPINDDPDTTDSIGDIIPDENCSVEDEVLRKIDRAEVIKLLDECKISDRNKEIIIKRYGLKGHNPTVLTELAEEYNLTHQRVNKIESQVLNRLKKDAEKKGLHL